MATCMLRHAIQNDVQNMSFFHPTRTAQPVEPGLDAVTDGPLAEAHDPAQGHRLLDGVLFGGSIEPARHS